jgi:hypothetical protein
LAGTTSALETNADVKRCVHDLVWRGIRSQLKREQVASAMGEMVITRSDLGSVIIDVLCLVDLEMVAGTKKDDRDRWVVWLYDLLFVNAFIRIIISRSTLDVTFDMYICMTFLYETLMTVMTLISCI